MMESQRSNSATMFEFAKTKCTYLIQIRAVDFVSIVQHIMSCLCYISSLCFKAYWQLAFTACKNVTIKFLKFRNMLFWQLFSAVKVLTTFYMYHFKVLVSQKNQIFMIFYFSEVLKHACSRQINLHMKTIECTNVCLATQNENYASKLHCVKLLNISDQIL